MRLIQRKSNGKFSLTEFPEDNIPPYAILSHTWGEDRDEVTFEDLTKCTGESKDGYAKIQFCAKQAAADSLQFFWVDTCCIDKSSSTELSEAIRSMFRWYREASKCYVYLSDVSTQDHPIAESSGHPGWEAAFLESRWFTRGWTLQELLAPPLVEFFSREHERLGDKKSLEYQIHKTTGIAIPALQGNALSSFSISERLSWASKRDTKRGEDSAYSLLGIFDIHMPLLYGEGRDSALSRLRKKIDKSSNYASIAGLVEHTGNMHWMVPRAVNTLFIGRTELLDRIQESFRISGTSSSQTQRRFVITGLGGLGKSEIALKAATLMRQEFWGIFWVDVDNPSLAESAFINVAKTIGSSVNSLQDALQVLANTKKSWLLILDNADDPNFDYQEYLPSGAHGAVIITSRLSECRLYNTVGFEALTGLDIQHSKELLLKAAGIQQDLWPSFNKPAEEVVHLLGSHTLALIQAGAYVAKGHCQLEQYPEVYQRQRKRLLEYKPRQGKSRYCNVYATFEASADVLERSDNEAAKDALCLLEVLSMLYSGSLPVQIFEYAWRGSREILGPPPIEAGDIDTLTSSHVSRLPNFISADSDTWDPYRLIEAISLLASLSLVTEDSPSVLSMHPLTHAWAKDRQNSKQQGLSWIAAGFIITVSESVSRSTLWLSQERQLRPHLQSYLDLKVKRILSFGQQDMVIMILVQCGWILAQMRDDSRLGHLLQDVFVELNIDPRTPSQEYLPIYKLEAKSLYNLGLHQRAVKLQEHVVQIIATTLAEDHPSRLDSQHELAHAYRANGQVKEAVELLEQIIQIEETTSADDHPDRLTSQHELACAYLANGQVKEAVELLEHVVKIRGTTLAEDHPSRLASQHELAGAYLANGQVKEAVELLEHVVKIKETTLGEDHPSRLASQHELAGAYMANGNGQLKEAIELLEHVVKIEGTTLAEDHPNRLTSQHELARAYKANGQVKEAVKLLEHVVKIKETTLSENHPDRIISEEVLASYRGAYQKISPLSRLKRLRGQYSSNNTSLTKRWKK